ncbi:MAG: AmmeMemoRadiSam system protein A [Oscillospiraceae bacterium]
MSITAGFLVPHPPLIVPQVGQGREKEISATIRSYRGVARQIGALSPQTIILFTPHSTVYSDYIHISPGKGAVGSLAQFGDPSPIKVRYDEALVRRVEQLCANERLPAGTLGEREPQLDHGTLVPLHFIREYAKDFSLVRVSSSGLSREEHYRFGMLLAQAVEELGRSAVVIASGDLSHKLTEDGPYGFAPEGPALDKALTTLLDRGEFEALFELDESLCERGAECGLRPLLMLAGALDKRQIHSKLLSYEGPFGVGYGVAAFAVGGQDPSRNFFSRRREKIALEMERIRAGEDPYVRLARQTLEEFVVHGKLPPLPENLPDEMRNSRAGVFVSLKKGGQLRGCIGTTGPTQPNLAEEIRHNAISAGTRDPRFSPVEPWELEDLVYSVDVLARPEPADESMLDPLRYGVIVERGSKRGLLLPNLDGVDTVEEQIAIARHKAGISGGKPVNLFRFEVTRHT